jgi:hypothetical protein
MPSLVLRIAVLSALSLLFLCAALLAPARADIVVLKDGHMLFGKVKRESQVILDSGQPFEIPKLFFLVDDHVRRVIFGSRQVEEVEPGDHNSEGDMITLRKQVINLDNFQLPSPMQLVSVAPWNEKWERVVKIRGPNTAADVPQRISFLTPYYLRADSLRYRWPVLYFTREYDPDTIRTLLAAHPDLKLSGDSGDATKRLRIARFLLQAGWLEHADQEYAAITRDFPEEKDKAEAGRDQARKLHLLEVVQEIHRAQEAGRSGWVQHVLKVLPMQGLDEKQQARLRELRTQHEAARDRLARAQRFLTELPPKIDDTPKRDLFTEAASAILAELTEETSSRLDGFAALALQAERERKNDRKPSHAPDQLMALAVSGWLLGNSVADTRVDAALRLWRGRQFVLDYLRSHSAAERRQMLQAYAKDNPASVDEIAQMLALLPPPEHVGPWSVVSAQWLTLTANQLAAPVHSLVSAAHLPLTTDNGPRTTPRIHKFQSDVPWSQRRGSDYWVQLPLEYQPGRLYPVLLALHHTGEEAQDILKRWGPLAAARGYVLVAPAWMRGFRATYDYTPEEHSAVLDVLWEVRRRFWVDADRVFLTGFGDGANMAYDVGLSHPHLFAGALPMGAGPRYFARAYKFNGQYLPFYAVDGDRNGKSPIDIREHFKLWVPRGYPVLYVEYKGRAFEWFAGELPHAFDWMSRKKRAAGFPDLGRGGGSSVDEGYTSMRPTDNRFYWLSADGLAERFHNNASQWRQLLSGGTLSGRISDGNNINVWIRGFKRATVWLGPGMVDADKPLVVKVNGSVLGGKRSAKPSLEVLMEDLYQRGDRQRPYWAKVEFGL